MSHAEDMGPDELTGRTARLQGLEIRVETGEKANQEVIGVRSTVKTLKQLIAAAITVGILVNAGIWLEDKSHHFATKEKVAEHDAELERVRLWQREHDTMMRSVIDAQKRELEGIDELKRFLMGNAPRRGHGQ